MTKKLAPEDQKYVDRFEDYSDARDRARPAYNLLNRRLPAPMKYEHFFSYRKRLATKVKDRSISWASVDLTCIVDDMALLHIEKQIYEEVVHDFEKSEPVAVECCCRCTFYDTNTCHRYAPKPITGHEDLEFSNQPVAHWPQVDESDFCGEFKPLSWEGFSA